jgi:hypothetical protein
MLGAASMKRWLFATAVASAGCQWLLAINSDVPILNARDGGDASATDEYVPMLNAPDRDDASPMDEDVAESEALDACAQADVASDPSNCGACGHSCQGGACLAGACQPVMLATPSGGHTIQDLAIDDTSVYWGEMVSGVGQVSKAGADAHYLVTGATPVSVAVDGERIYVSLGYAVFAYAKSGSQSTLVAPGLAFNLIVDPGGFEWAEQDVVDGATLLSLWRAPFDADGGFMTPAAVATGLGSAAIATDGQNLFYSQFMDMTASCPRPAYILREPIAADGSAGTVLACASINGYGRAIAVNSTNVVWIDRCTQGIWTAPKTADALQTMNCLAAGTRQLTAGPSPSDSAVASASSVALGGGLAVWTERGAGNVKAIPVDGSCAEPSCVRVLAAGRNAPDWIVADDHAAYWAEENPTPGIFKIAF